MWRNSGRVDLLHLRISKSLFTRHAYLLSLTYGPVCGEDILKTWIIVFADNVVLVPIHEEYSTFSSEGQYGWWWL